MAVNCLWKTIRALVSYYYTRVGTYSSYCLMTEEGKSPNKMLTGGNWACRDWKHSRACLALAGSRPDPRLYNTILLPLSPCPSWAKWIKTKGFAVPLAFPKNRNTNQDLFLRFARWNPPDPCSLIKKPFSTDWLSSSQFWRDLKETVRQRIKLFPTYALQRRQWKTYNPLIRNPPVHCIATPPPLDPSLRILKENQVSSI
jgi:hypothetical protein